MVAPPGAVPTALEVFPISASGWWQGIKDRKVPAGFCFYAGGDVSEVPNWVGTTLVDIDAGESRDT